MSENNGHEVFISLGSNLGDRATNLRVAKERLTEGMELITSSSIYETPPWGVIDQPSFFNQVVLVSTPLSPVPLLSFLKRIERSMGRVKTIRFGPRLIDLDILLFDARQVNRPLLTIPHPRMCQRAFVLVPLAEIASEKSIPGTGLTVQEHLEKLDATGIRRVDLGSSENRVLR